ncbi:hypothetical protein [Amycolatopsis japonica]|uniref:hypothetical protein n=1 Tax=Amycolatopsis japonica TaxID=208439 RepID=UPI00380F0655
MLRRAHEPRKGAWGTVRGFLSGAENLRFAGTYPSVYGDTGLKTIGLAFADCEAAVPALITGSRGW